MKVVTWILFSYTLLAITSAIKSNIYAPFHIISLNDITPDERRQIAYLEQKLERSKRSGGGSGSGSTEILNLLKTAVGNGIKKKIGQLTMASAAASGAFSRSSSGGGKEYHHYPQYHHHEVYHQPSFDFWDLKKSILNTLLQAVKAIKGGVLAIKGQLIKGGGKLVSASGQLVSAKGEAITNIGKSIATNAILVPYHASSSKGPTHADYVDHETHYSGPSAPEEIYHNGPPSGPSIDYHVPENYPPVHREGADGLLLLKKITPKYSHHISARQSVSPSTATIFSKFFSASSSLDPQKPELFGDYPRPVDNIDSYQAYFVKPHKENEVVASASGVVTQTSQDVATTQVTKNKVVPSTSYGSPFEESPEYLDQNFDNLVVSPSINQHKTLDNDNNIALNDKANFSKEIRPDISFAYDFKDSEFSILTPPPIQDSISDVTTNSFQELNKLTDTSVMSNKLVHTPSRYLQTPKLKYSLNTLNDDFSSSNFGFKYTKPHLSFPRPNTKTVFEQDSPFRQEAASLDLVPSITYEIGPDGPKLIT